MPKLKPSRGPKAFMEFAEEIHEKQTDRGAVIMSAAFIDDRLTDLIAAFMQDDRLISKRKSDCPILAKEIFEGTGPLAGFSSRINVAYAFGIIDDTEYHNLHTVREIRNHFAHFSHKLSFQTPEIATLGRKLRLGISRIDDEAAGFVSNDPRGMYLEIIRQLADRIMGKYVNEKKLRRGDPSSVKPKQRS